MDLSYQQFLAVICVSWPVSERHTDEIGSPVTSSSRPTGQTTCAIDTMHFQQAVDTGSGVFYCVCFLLKGKLCSAARLHLGHKKSSLVIQCNTGPVKRTRLFCIFSQTTSCCEKRATPLNMTSPTASHSAHSPGSKYKEEKESSSVVKCQS